MSTILVAPVASTTILMDAEAIAVVQLNSIFRRSGLHVTTASTQLHIIPEAVYFLSQDDVAVLSRLARTLVRNASVECDFSALCGVLWGHTKEVEKVIDQYAQKPLHDELRPHDSSWKQLTPHLLLLADVFNTLRHFEEPFAILEVRDAVNIVQKDVEFVVTLALKVGRMFDAALKNIQRCDVALLRALELCHSTIVMYAAALATRKSLEVNPVLALFNSDMTWHLSGAGEVATKSYCESIRRLIFAVFARQDDFVGVEQVAVQLLLHRLTNRPPFDWESFRRLYVRREAELSSMTSRTPQYGMLCYMSIVQQCVEALLLSDEPWTKSLRRKTFETLCDMNKKHMLSFFQVPLLGALERMPVMDLTEDAELRRRAVATHLIAEENISNKMPSANFLRILLAHGYTVPQAEHGALSRTSILSLLRAIADELFQVSLVQSGETEKLTDLTLIPPVLTTRVLRLIVDAAAADVKTAREVMAEVHRITDIIYEANTSQCASLLSAQKMPIPLRRISVSTMKLLFMFFESHAILSNTDHSMALEALGRVYAVLAFYSSANNKKTTVNEKKAMLRMIQNVNMKLSSLAQMMRAEELNSFFVNVILPCTSTEKLQQKNRQQYALQEAYLRSFASSAVAFAMDETTMLRHWVDTSLNCIKNPLSAALSIAGLDFLSAVFLSRRTIAPLFVPTYVALMIPITNSKKYGEPPMFLLRHFAKGVRASCQGVEECDEQALVGLMQNPNSTVRQFLSTFDGEGMNKPELDNVRPLACVLLIVSTLFEKVCMILGNTPAVETTFSRQERVARFQAYFSALINLLQCRSRTVLHRVCVSIETVLLEHLRGVRWAQSQWMKYITATVDLIDGTGKKELVEWLFKLKEKVGAAIPHSRL